MRSQDLWVFSKQVFILDKKKYFFKYYLPILFVNDLSRNIFVYHLLIEFTIYF